MSWINKIREQMPEPSSPKQLRSFGLIVACGFFVIALLPILIHRQNPRVWALIISGVFAIPALVVPAALRSVYKVWMLLGHYLGLVNTRIILTALFYLVFTPVSLVMRLMKRDSMSRKFEPQLDTYRVVKNPRPPTHLRNQF